ncbi:MAG: hypothetical protein MEQ74_05010 [Paracoccus sp.]|nr:hypothetical protein [Paracoccus sp. (in: a-proteobacteria)]
MNMNIESITRAMQAKSDQLNAEDLLGGPRTIKITGGVEKDNKIRLNFEGDAGRPWVLSKTAVRILAACWGMDPSKWIGLSCTVYNDESVVYGGKEVGGIRVSHVEGIQEPRSLNLTVIRGKKKEHVIAPMVVERQSKADAWRERLLAVTQNPDMTVEEAWAKVPPAMKKELGEALYAQLVELEKAAAAHAKSDDAVLGDLNSLIAAE